MSRWKKEKPTDGALYLREWTNNTEAGKAYKKRAAEYAKEWRKKNKEKFHATQKACYDRARLEALNHYCPDGIKCACCGETEQSFLSFDHINNDGNVQRKKVIDELGYRPSGNSIVYTLKKQGYPKDIQVLCMNCNTGKHRNGGICPHKKEKTI